VIRTMNFAMASKLAGDGNGDGRPHRDATQLN
jgi:hypothetical protein